MSPERHHWKPAVQAAAVMLKMPPRRRPFAGQPATPASHISIQRAILRTPPSPAGHRPAARTHPAERSHYILTSLDGRKLVTRFALCCHSNATRAPIANPPNSAQPGGSPYHSPKLHPGPCNNVGIRPWTDTHTQTHTQTHTHTDEPDHNTYCVVYDSRKM